MALGQSIASRDSSLAEYNVSRANLQQRFFGRGLAKPAIRSCLRDCDIARIATAFFEPSGWALLADVLDNKEVRLLVGREEGAADKATDLLSEFFQEIQSGMLVESPIVLRQLLSALRAGKLAIHFSAHKIAGSIDVRYLYHHAKLYIADDTRAIVTSANFSGTGLELSREAGYLITAKTDVAYFVEQFDEFFSEAQSLTAEFIEALEELLELRSPEEIYLRSLLEIYGMPEGSFASSLPSPAPYQTPVISRLVRGISDLGGAFLVASTGLGKTIIAAHTVAILRSREKINAVLVIAPAGLRDMWVKAMRAARISSREFSYYILSIDDWKSYRQAMLLDDELQRDMNGMLLILDESHHMRNDEDSAKQVGLKHKRILRAVERGAKILMLTATPYSRGIEDINNQLRLLPEHRVKGHFFETDRSWRIEKPSELPEIPPCTVLTAPTVVRHFSETDEFGNRFVRFGNDRRLFFPERIHLRTIHFNNPYNQILRELKASNLLRKRTTSHYESDLFDQPIAGKRDYLFEARLLHQFCSSKSRVRASLESMAKEGGYENIRFEAQVELTELTTQMLRNLEAINDSKEQRLLELISTHISEKIVIFCIYKETARQLQQKLRREFPTIRIETTVDAAPDDLENILDYFAPIANDRIFPGSERTEHSERFLQNKIDVLIASEAISEGFNLQDSRILINYDLPWSVLQLAQRMGRLMRPWHEVRELLIYNFLPDTMSDDELKHGKAWRQRLERRNKEHQAFASLPVILPQDNEAIRLESLSVALQQFESEDLRLDEAMDFIGNATQVSTSSVLDDLAQISTEKAGHVRKLRAGFRSRVSRKTGDPKLYLLIGLRSSIFPAMFTDKAELAIPAHEVTRPLEELRRRKTDAVFRQDFDPVKLDQFEKKCLQTWLTNFGETREKVRIICALHFN